MKLVQCFDTIPFLSQEVLMRSFNEL